ncbi:Wzz/FepE/Etk N-terminal domain-containing protein [[Ruminococcus] torques]|nr:Wzz/FepE/Etk N-terminal domain-containing protein [[Ruminococcus] torques]
MEKTHDEEMAIDLWELISALKKRALIILAACLLGGVVAGVYTKLCITPMYTATSSMLVTTQETTLTSIARPSAWKRSYGRLQYSCDKPERS